MGRDEGEGAEEPGEEGEGAGRPFRRLDASGKTGVKERTGSRGRSVYLM